MYDRAAEAWQLTRLSSLASVGVRFERTRGGDGGPGNVVARGPTSLPDSGGGWWLLNHIPKFWWQYNYIHHYLSANSGHRGLVHLLFCLFGSDFGGFFYYWLCNSDGTYHLHAFSTIWEFKQCTGLWLVDKTFNNDTLGRFLSEHSRCLTHVDLFCWSLPIS